MFKTSKGQISVLNQQIVIRSDRNKDLYNAKSLILLFDSMNHLK